MHRQEVGASMARVLATRHCASLRCTPPCPFLQCQPTIQAGRARQRCGEGAAPLAHPILGGTTSLSQKRLLTVGSGQPLGRLTQAPVANAGHPARSKQEEAIPHHERSTAVEVAFVRPACLLFEICYSNFE